MLPTKKLRVAERLGVLGAVSVTVGAPRSIRVSELTAALGGPLRSALPLRYTEELLSDTATVPSVWQVAVTVKLVPVDPLTEREQPPAEPVTVRSELESSSMAEPKLRLKVLVRELDSANAAVKLETVGRAR